MSTNSLDRLLTQLEEAKTQFEAKETARIASLLQSLSKRRFPDAASLLRFHESLLFLRAFPANSRILLTAEKILAGFADRVRQLQAREADLSVFEDFDGAGVFGTTMQDSLSFELARWLVRRLPGKVEVAWDEYDDERAMAAIWPRLLPLLEEDACVEANIPWREWLSAAKGNRAGDLAWLIAAFEQLPVSEQERSRLYDSQQLPIRWSVDDFRFSRTGNWARPKEIFYHREPLITRAQVSLNKELSRPQPEMHRLSRRDGEGVMEQIREVMAVRYRELYGTTLGDPESVRRAEVGRGVVIYLWNLPEGKRLPLRAYVAGFTLKNGVPINYIEAIGLCEWMEVGFNTFYTFRGGETAWIFAQALRCLVAMTGIKCISIYPYQIGQNNEEALESGAFWFYRKLGFRPGGRDLLELTQREENKIAGQRGYRTSVRTLKKLAGGHMFFELPGSEAGAWDSFSTRNIGLAVNRRMGQAFGGSSNRMRKESMAAVSQVLGIETSALSEEERRCFGNWAPVLGLIPGLDQWSNEEKQNLLQIVKAQAGPDEMRYLKLTQQHERLRRELLRLECSAHLAGFQ